MFSRNLSFNSSSGRSTINDEFETAKERLRTLKEDPGDEVKLKIYSLFKQSSVGKCNTPKPGMLDFVGKAKWEAWRALGDMSKDSAKQAYVDLVNDLVGKKSPRLSTSNVSAKSNEYTTIVVTKSDGVFTILLNRPEKKNAIIKEMYFEWMEALDAAAADPDVNVAMITGAGDFFCSGNDLSNFSPTTDISVEEMADTAYDVLFRFIAKFIDFPKPLIAALNGPAVGISVTTLPLYDAVFASERATFSTPFSHLGQTPEGCSSFTFPAIMGWARANDMIMFNRVISAREAMDRGLVTRVLPHQGFAAEVRKIAAEFADLPPETLVHAKNVIRSNLRQHLHQVNRAECDRLRERWTSSECVNAVLKFFMKKQSKL